jgi:hypothetical protein
MPKPASQAAAGYQEPDFAAIVAKPPTALQEHFHTWVLEKTEYDPAKAKTKAEAFAEGIRIGTALRGVHQASPENQERLAEAKAAREAAAAVAEPKPAKAAAKAAPAKAAAKAAPAKKAAAPPAEAPQATKRAPAKKAPGRKATPAVVVSEDDEAPF